MALWNDVMIWHCLMNDVVYDCNKCLSESLYPQTTPSTFFSFPFNLLLNLSLLASLLQTSSFMRSCMCIASVKYWFLQWSELKSVLKGTVWRKQVIMLVNYWEWPYIKWKYKRKKKQKSLVIVGAETRRCSFWLQRGIKASIF